ncbi:MotA/TolQ/ExbB proton channel family protein [Crateriforma spongiae]|uniref:MotA/TolQ/ExbB proton channel family protein n=1 Tax=Crateriforma spongiae TaxID=2724528 RepID=UPI0039AEFBA8
MRKDSQASAEQYDNDLPDSPVESGGVLPICFGILAAGAFYAAAYVLPWAPIQRYFLGHAVAVAATVLFFVALASLIAKGIQVRAQTRRTLAIRDLDLTPELPPVGQASPTDRYRDRHDVRFVAQRWSETLAELPESVRNSLLVQRLREVLHRQSLRGNAAHLADDLREVAGRDADASHDSFGLVRIIVWAIPMLGFLGTVIGITQTLGGLDFTDGAAAVDRLKSGLYVAFDTTALGLVLSVVAIFLQFPVERSEQRLLATIDKRVGPLLSAHLPSEDKEGNTTDLIVSLCDGIRTAVAQSLASQTDLWRQTIDVANEHWKSVHETDADRFADAIENTLSQTLRRHSDSIAGSLHAFNSGNEKMVDLQQDLISHTEKLALLYHQTDKLHAAQNALDANLERLAMAQQQIDIAADADQRHAAMSDAVRTLARAVDFLSARMAEPGTKIPSQIGRAA